MNRKYNIYILAILALSIFTWSCRDNTINTADKALMTIPQDASMVTSIDIKSLMDKADFENTKQLEFYQDWINETKRYNPAVSKILEDPSKSGINLTQNAYLSLDISTKNPSDFFSAAVLNLSDPSAFSDLLAQMNEGAVEDRDLYKIIKFNANNIVAWNDEIAVIGGSSRSKMVDINLEKIFNTEESTSIVQNKAMQLCFKEKHDVTSWMSSNAIAQIKDAKLAMDMIGIKPSALTDNYTHAFLDFENGKVAGLSKFFVQDDLANELRLFFKDHIESDFSNYIPGESLASLVSGAVDLNGINQVLSERPQVKGYVEFLLKEYGIGLGDLANAFGGDFVLANYGDGNEIEGMMITDINDQKVFNDFLKVGLDYEMIVKEKEGMYRINISGKKAIMGYQSSLSEGGYVLVHDKKVFLSADIERLNNIQNGSFKPASEVDKNVKQLMNNNILSWFAKSESLPNSVGGGNLKEVEEMMMSIDRGSAKFDLLLKDDSQNSLKRILEIINDEYVKNGRRAI